MISAAGTQFLCEDVGFGRQVRDACKSAVMQQTVSFAGGLKAMYIASRTYIAMKL